MKNIYASFILCLFAYQLGHGAENSDYLRYDIPADAVQDGPHATRHPDEQVFDYYLASSPRSTESYISREVYNHGILIRRELFRDGKKQGLQVQWYDSGALKMEAPYKEGRMEGVFQVWDESGRLIGQYRMVAGTGRQKVFDHSGSVVTDCEYVNGARKGRCIERSENVISLLLYENGEPNGAAYNFFGNGRICTIAFFSHGKCNGPFVEYSTEGVITRSDWFIAGQKISALDYQAAASRDPSLPIYHADPSRYRQMIDRESIALMGRYLSMPLVQIPLVFDNEGNPLMRK